MKTRKGISLIVLVITIIIMIIIAGAVIISLTETNIIDQAQSAVGKHNDAELKQRITLTLAEAQANRYSEEIVTNNLKSIFEEVYGKDNITVVKSGNNYKVKLKDNNEVLKVKTDGTIEEYKEMAPTSVYARLDDEGILYLRATEKEGYNIYKNYKSIQSNWNTAGDATPTSVAKVIIEEEIAPTTTTCMFATMNNLIEIENMQYFHAENVTNMFEMFYGCTSLVSIELKSFDSSKANNMGEMFYKCKSLTSLDLTNLETKNVTNMTGIFTLCENLKSVDVTNFNTINVTDMSGMFQNCYSLENIDVKNFDTQNVATMSSMFNGCRSLTSIDVSNFNTKNVKKMSGMFAACYSLTNLDISNFNTQQVINMHQMFLGSKLLKTIILSEKYIINDEIDTYQILNGVPSDIKITATEETRDKLISASSLTEDNFEIIK